MLILGKPQASIFQNHRIDLVLQGVIQLMEPQALLNNVTIELNVHTSCDVYCDENQIWQVFVNIIKNGIEAMVNGGLLTVQIRNENQQVHIRFTDEGPGLSPELLSRLGDPFFTTKEQGTGLGVIVMKRVIENHQGKLDFSSEPGKGTCVMVSLPSRAESQNLIVSI